MHATYKQIYDRLADGRKVKIRFSDRKQADSLRVRLVRWNQQFVAVSITDKSLCMKWNEEERVAVFSLENSNSRELTTFEILEDPSDNEQASESTSLEEDSVSDTLEQNPHSL